MTTPAESQFEDLLNYLKSTRGFDFTAYKRSSLMRRVVKRMQSLGITGFRDYLDDLEVHPEEFAQPQQMLLKIRESLKPDGRLVLLEYRGEDPEIPIRPEHKMTREQVKLEVEHEGFTLKTVNEDLPRQHIFVFTR